MASTIQEMEEAAKEAEKEFPKEGSAKDVAEWWCKWLQKAGHKRLGRAMLRVMGKRGGDGPG